MIQKKGLTSSKNDFGSRLLIGCFGIILTVLATFVNIESTIFLMVAVWTFIFLELTSILELPELVKDVFFFFSVLLFIGCFFLLQTGNIVAIITIGAFWLFGILAICFNQKQKNYFFSFLYMVYLTIPFAFLVSLRKMNGSSMFFLLFLIVWALDIFSYCFGISLGKNLIAPKISPKKTWEGTIFGILFSFATGLFGFYYLLKDLSLLIIIACLLFPIIGFFGDLFESSIKRQVRKKDSGTILLGHGGYLDRFDSMMFVSVFFFILTRFL
jgi:phosphatidate cytidylyltransferase